MKDPIKVAAGKRSRRLGNNFEKKVREDLENRGFIVDKWTNKIVPETGKLSPVKPYWVGNRMLMNTGGFPDFVRWQSGTNKIEGVESKMDGVLDKEEKDKARALLKHKVFDKIWIASKIKNKNRIKVYYEDFEEKYAER